MNEFENVFNTKENAKMFTFLKNFKKLKKSMTSWKYLC